MEKLNQIKLLLLDVDGVLTDGRIVCTDSGEEIKAFDVKDGLGIRLLQQAGIQVGVITGRTSSALRRRVQNLGINLVWDGVDDKTAVLETACRRAGVTPRETAFVGDDLVDLGIFRRVGLSIAVADAHAAVLQKAGMITAAKGGAGAVREICDALLKAAGVWESVVASFEENHPREQTH